MIILHFGLKLKVLVNASKTLERYSKNDYRFLIPTPPTRAPRILKECMPLGTVKRSFKTLPGGVLHRKQGTLIIYNHAGREHPAARILIATTPARFIPRQPSSPGTLASFTASHPERKHRPSKFPNV